MTPSKERDLIPIFFWLIYYIISFYYFVSVNKKSLKWILKSQLSKKGFNFPEFHNQISHLKPEENNRKVVEIILNDINKKHDIAEFQKNSLILNKFLEKNKYYVKEYIIEILIRDYKKWMSKN